MVFEKMACASIRLALYSHAKVAMKDRERREDVDLTVWTEKNLGLRGQQAFWFASNWWISSPTPVDTKKDEIEVF